MMGVLASPSTVSPPRQGAPTPQHTPPKEPYTSLPVPVSPRDPSGTSSPNSNQSSGSNSPSGTPKLALPSLNVESVPLQTTSTAPSTAVPTLITVPERNVVYAAHYGYIYCIALADGSWNNADKAQLVTGSGDEDVKLWEWSKSSEDQPASVSHLHTFYGGVGAVLSLISRNGNVYAGCQDGHVKIWDLETKTLVRTIIAQQNVDVLSLSMIDSDLYTASANGWIHRYSASFECTASWKAHSGIALSSIIVPSKQCPNSSSWDRYDLVTGASDNCIKLWSITRPPKPRTAAEDSDQKLQRSLSKRGQTPPNDDVPCIESNDTMIVALSQFVSFPSVSNHERHKEDCRQAARWLKNCFTQLGGESQLLYGEEGKNPLVLGTFRGAETRGPKRRILFYGHYDVIAAGSHSGWMYDPYSLTGLNGYLYGRGVSDNKGPILAAACAASEMLAKRSLNVDLVMLIEGEEEAGSAGFEEAVIKHKEQIGPIDSILVSNSYWIDDVSPCITYGLRGVVHATIEINSGRPDVHSGVEGGGSTEPMIDMVKLLSKLTDGPKINLPGFYDHVRPMSKQEAGSYELLAKVTGQTAGSFSSRWREPSFSIHSVHDSGPGNSTIIPAHVRAKVSIRLVPDQDLATVVSSLEECVKNLFNTLGSPNELKFIIDKTADWWLGELDDVWFKTLERAVTDEWGVQPLRIREGGSIPSIPFLEKEFKCHALHLPMGQSSDQAHLRNERISLNNLRKGRAVMERFLGEIPNQP
ncbi:hypothetical protein FRC03_012908 [Tulasnella sp. 419]|nr:hypothetical protein FRC03_012908 [Tulasnella sp. 419]